MCGIAGIVHFGSEATGSRLASDALSMRARLRHRGPDAEGLWESADKSCAFAHTRLSIIDLSAASDQPFTDPTGRFVLVFNGEIYNYRSLRERLAGLGSTFRSAGDTEVIIEAFRHFGEACVDHLQGMYAFAIWDSQRATLFLARDALGIKPLYYCLQDKRLAFASEVQALLALEWIPRKIDNRTLHGYLCAGSVPEPHTLLHHIRAVEAGHTIMVSSEGIVDRRFWRPSFPPPPATESDYPQVVRDAIIASVDRHLISDVPVGCFLSGGIDSNALVAITRKILDRPLSTYSIGFADRTYDESDLADQTAYTFGTDHHRLTLHRDDAEQWCEEYFNSMDQPTHDGFNTFCVSRFAASHGCKVVMSGIGGDELFGGYPSFRVAPKLSTFHWSLRSATVRAVACGVVSFVRGTQYAERLRQFATSDGGPLAAWQAVRTVFSSAEATKLVDWLSGCETQYVPPGCSSTPLDPRDAIALAETELYLRNQLLRDSDVMSMRWGLELRTPLVDQSVCDAIYAIPAATRVRSGKQLLLAAIPEIPVSVQHRRKRGFTLPLSEWRLSSLADSEVCAVSPVPLRKWYQAWTLEAAYRFFRRHDIPLCGSVARSVCNSL